MRLTLKLLGGIVGFFLVLAMMLTWERPPLDSMQLGYRGTGMVEIENPRRAELLAVLNQAPAPQEQVAPGGTRASDVYENVQVLGDLDADQFNRLMAAITEWVSPEQGCNYCHNPENLAEDSVYTKVVARKMLQMTRHINTAWQPHVQQTGVTCYTCHRGQPVPAQVSYVDAGSPHAAGMSASREGQNLATKAVGTTSLPYDPLTPLLAGSDAIRVQARTALPSGGGSSIQATEKTYALMMHMSQALGVNCTFCHNSRAFEIWEESRPQRVTAWHGIQMARDVNAAYLDSLKDVFPASRKGPAGDVAKVNCATCHQGVNKPLLGAPMVKDYPELSQAN